MMPGSKGQKAVHACMIRLLNLRFVGIKLGAKDFLPPTSLVLKVTKYQREQFL